MNLKLVLRATILAMRALSLNRKDTALAVGYWPVGYDPETNLCGPKTGWEVRETG